MLHTTLHTVLDAGLHDSVPKIPDPWQKVVFFCRFSVETQSQTASELGMNWAGEVVAQALLAQMRGMELPSHPSLSSARGFGPAYEL